MDHTSRKFLHLIVNEAPNMEDGYFTLDYVALKVGVSDGEAQDCLNFLEENGLVSCFYIDNEELRWKHALWGFTPSHKGRHHVEFATLELIDTVMKSILLPIVVSIITALLIA